MSSDLPRRNRFSLFRAKRPFFPLAPPCSMPPPAPSFPPDARSASVCNLISAMRDSVSARRSHPPRAPRARVILFPLCAVLPCRIYLYIYRYRVSPSALLLFDHAVGIYIRLRVLFTAARIRCFLHPGIAPRPVSFDMLLSGVCIACFALVRSRSLRHNIRLRVHLPMFAYVVFPMLRCRTAARDHICVAPRRIMSYGTGLGPSRTRTFAAREKFLCARPTRKFIFRAPR